MASTLEQQRLDQQRVKGKPVAKEDRVSVKNLSKTFRSKGQIVKAVNNVSFDVKRGSVLGLLGLNGSGKTTTLKMLCGLVKPDAGEISIFGLDPNVTHQSTKGVGTVFESNRGFYWRLTALENLVYFAVLRGLPRRLARQRAIELLKELKLEHKQDTLAGKLSRGMQQRLLVAIALVNNPTLLLLDEPTIGLDVGAYEDLAWVIRNLSQRGVAIILASHELDFVGKLAHEIAVIHQGQIVLQQKTELFTAASPMADGVAAYTITLAPTITLPMDLHQCLTRLGARVSNNVLSFHASCQQFWELLRQLEGYDIESITKEKRSLSEALLVLRETPNAVDG